MSRKGSAYMKNLKLALNKADKQLNQYQFLTGNAVKIIATICMFIDHFAKTVLIWVRDSIWVPRLASNVITHEEYNQQVGQLLRLGNIGMIAFPLFAFLLTEGFCHTHSRKKYALSLALFAIISELPFDLAFFNDLASRRGTFPFYWEYQNVFFTLLLGLCAIWCIERLSSLEGKFRKMWIRCLQIGCITGISLIAFLIKSDYGIRGILIIVIFYISRKNRICQALSFLLGYMILENSLHISQIIVCIIVLLYNKKRGNLKVNKYAFYAFYPVHILLLYCTTLLLTHLLG